MSVTECVISELEQGEASSSTDEDVEIIVRAKLHSIQHVTVASGVGSGGAYVKSEY
jgi:hypothetical protein